MSKLILVANWKNHPSSLEEAKGLLKEMGKKKELYKKLALFIAPPLPYMESVSERAASFSKLAAQDITLVPKGNYTGLVSLDILKSFGARLAILGQSERRAMGETSEEVSQKIKAVLRAGIVPLVCVGENERDKDGDHFEFLRGEIKQSLAGVSKQSTSSLIIAYEPVWVIGKSAKDALLPGDLAQSVIFIKKVLSDIFGRNTADKISIVYGGAGEPTNAGALVKETGVAGFLVGHASLRAKWLEEIANSLISK